MVMITPTSMEVRLVQRARGEEYKHNNMIKSRSKRGRWLRLLPLLYQYRNHTGTVPAMVPQVRPRQDIEELQYVVLCTLRLSFCP